MDKNTIIGLGVFLTIVIFGLIYAFIKKPQPPLLPESSENKGLLYPLIDISKLTTTTTFQINLSTTSIEFNLNIPTTIPQILLTSTPTTTSPITTTTTSTPTTTTTSTKTQTIETSTTTATKTTTFKKTKK